MLKKVTPRIKNLAHARLSKIPGLVEHPGFRFDLGLEGYRNYTFGGKAGPAVCISNIFHEIAHAIEFGSSNFRKRVSAGGYIFKSPKTKFLFGEMYQEYNKHFAIERELRTAAIQVKLMKLSGIKKTEEFLIEDIVSAMKYMPDFDNVPVTAENRTNEQ